MACQNYAISNHIGIRAVSRAISWIIIMIAIIIITVAKKETTATTSLPPVIPIGALFETGDESLYSTMRQAIDRVNRNPRLLPGSNLTLAAYFVAPHDSFKAARLSKYP